MKLSSDRIKAKHWIPVNGNGKINFRNCSDPNQCDPNNGKIGNESAWLDQHDVNKTALIEELNANLSNLTKELKAATDKSVVINTSIAIHHIHKGVKGDTDAAGNNGIGIKRKLNDLLAASTEINHIETENEDNKINEQQSESVDGQSDDKNDLDNSDGLYDNVVHVFAVSSINTTKSVRQNQFHNFITNLIPILICLQEQIMKLPPMVPVSLILMLVMCATLLIIFVAIYVIRKSKASSHTQTDSCTIPEDITLSDQIVQKPLPGNLIII